LIFGYAATESGNPVCLRKVPSFMHGYQKKSSSN